MDTGKERKWQILDAIARCLADLEKMKLEPEEKLSVANTFEQLGKHLKET